MLQSIAIVVTLIAVIAASPYDHTNEKWKLPNDAYVEGHWAADRAQLGLESSGSSYGKLELVRDLDNRILHCPPESAGNRV